MRALFATTPVATSPVVPVLPRLAPAVALTLTLLAASLLAPGQAAAAPDCKPLYELYQNCFETGLNSDSAQTCMSMSFHDMERTAVRLNSGAKKKKPGASQAMVELVCSTGCDDATTTQIRASQSEFTEAFCE